MARTVCLLATVLALALGVTSPASADDARPRIVFVGDSITARYATTGDAEGWWSMVGHELGYEPVKVAMSGVGFLRKQPSCRGIRFGGLLRSVIAERPDKIVVAGGRNDWRDCASRRHASRATVRNHIFWYFRALNARLPQMGLEPSDVFVMSPWGSAASSHGWIRAEVRRQGMRFGFTFVPTGYLADRWTVDRTHPNAEGNVELARRVLLTMRGRV